MLQFSHSSPMLTLTYTKEWFRAARRITEVWDESKARKAHQAAKQYDVVIGDVDHPECFLTVSRWMNFLSVNFLNDQILVDMECKFSLREGGKLFLLTTLYRHFDANTGLPNGYTEFFSREDGCVKLIFAISPDPLKIAYSTTDINDHYFEFPEFGNYDHIVAMAREARDKGPDPKKWGLEVIAKEDYTGEIF